MDREHLLRKRERRVYGAMRLLAMKTFTTFYRRIIVLVRPLDAMIPAPAPRVPVVITMLTEKDLPAYSSFRPSQGPKVIQERFACGDRCFAAWHEGRIVHAAWVASRYVHMPYLRRTVILEAGDAGIYDSYTLASYRNQRLAQARSIHMLQQYRQEGYRRTVGLIAPENESSLRQVQAVGYRPLGLYGCVRLGHWQWDWQQRWGEESLPALTKME
jgi:GNAT superfamily N-acetyltransferase